MFWNNHPALDSARFRILFFYMASVVVSLLACGAMLLAFAIHRENADLNKTLRFFSSEFEFEYLTGREELVNAKRIPPSKLPDELQRVDRSLMAYALPDGGFAHIALNGGKRLMLMRDARTGEISATALEADAIPFINGIFNRESHGDGTEDLYMAIFSPEQSALAKSPCPAPILDAMLKGDAFASAGFQDAIVHLGGDERRLAGSAAAAPAIYRRRSHSAFIRTYTRLLYDGNRLVVASDATVRRDYLMRMAIAFAAELAVMLVFGMASGMLLARKFANAIGSITEAARGIKHGDFSRRATVPNVGGEMRLLATTFNDMSENTERIMHELRTISDNIAHDLRTPLTRMRGEAELSLYSGDAANLAGNVAEECGAMLDMINTMLDITQTENNINTARREPVDLAGLAGKMLALYSSLAEDRQIRLRGELPSTPLLFSGHRAKLQQMLGNLLDNALKFTPPGGAVAVSLAAVEGAIRLRVSDTGIGIEAEDQPRIFDRFYRADASRSLPGNGLGLSLVKAIVTSYGGRISVESAPGVKTVFEILLPV